MNTLTAKTKVFIGVKSSAEWEQVGGYYYFTSEQGTYRLQLSLQQLSDDSWSVVIELDSRMHGPIINVTRKFSASSLSEAEKGAQLAAENDLFFLRDALDKIQKDLS